MLNHRGRIAALLPAMLLMAGLVAADAPKDAPAKPVATAGVFTENKPDFAMIWTDGEDAPVKYAFDASCDKSQLGKMTATGIFGPIRVKITYTDGDGGRKLLSVRRESPPASGQIVGEVKFVADNFFWIAVKPRNGPLDGFAMGFPPGAIAQTMKKLQKGDWVAIKYHTDFERHRIDALEVKPPAPAPPPKPEPAADAASPTSAPAPAAAVATSQPLQSPQAKAQAKLKLAQLYIDNDRKDQARAMLKDIVKLYPDTDAANEAKSKLTTLGGE